MIHIEWRERVVLVTIDRPERRNAVDLDTLIALRAALDEGYSNHSMNLARAFMQLVSP